MEWNSPSGFRKFHCFFAFLSIIIVCDLFMLLNYSSLNCAGPETDRNLRSGSDQFLKKKKMVELGLLSGSSSKYTSSKPVNVSFRIPYYTEWGQSLLVCGSEPVLGSWNIKRGLLLSPVHHGKELIWFGTVCVPKGFKCNYTYYVVDEKRNVMRWEMGDRRKVLLPEGIQDGEAVELHDLWQVSFFLSFSTFSVINTFYLPLT